MDLTGGVRKLRPGEMLEVKQVLPLPYSPAAINIENHVRHFFFPFFFFAEEKI